MAYLITLVITAFVAGWLAGLVTRGRGFGLIGNILVAFAGAITGAYFFDLIGIGFGSGPIDTALAAFLGAFALLAIVAQMRS